MVEGLTIMLGVFINLLDTHTMPNNHYCSTYMMPHPQIRTSKPEAAAATTNTSEHKHRHAIQ